MRCSLLSPVILVLSLGTAVGQTSPPSKESAPSPSVSPAALATDERPVSWKTIAPNTLEDQKAIYFDFPKSLGKRQNWVPTSAFLVGIGTLIGTDQFVSPYFRHTSTYQAFNRGFSGTNSSLMIVAVPAVTYITGLVRKDHYATSTALLTGEAVADSEIAAELLKISTRRQRPESVSLTGNFADTWSDSQTITNGGFPSGHTIAAFAVATIMSRRYGHNHRWVPYASYGLATAIGLSRVTLSAHNISDVAAGAAFGYVISRFVVLSRHHLYTQANTRPS